MLAYDNKNTIVINYVLCLFIHEEAQIRLLLIDVIF